jgi:hypothetical protein
VTPAPAGPGALPRARPGSGATRTSGLAIASLVLSLLGCFFLTAIAGVICGHIARKKIRRDPSLSGNGLALAGLVIGYVMIALMGFFLTTFVINFYRVAKQVKAEMQSGSFSTNFTSGGVEADRPPLPVPANAVRGTIKGQPFTYTKSTLNKAMSMLTISEGSGFIADREVTIFLFLKPDESLENRTFRFNATGNGMFPHVHLSWKADGANEGLKTQTVTSGYTLEMKTGSITDKSISGSIHLKVTGKTPAELDGNFNATVE